MLSALRAEQHIVAAALYDEDQRIVARHPDTLNLEALPAAPGPTGYRFDGPEVSGFQPVMQQDRRLGTLYLNFDTGILLREFVWGSVRIALAAVAVILLLSCLLSLALQRHISQPILALVGTARAITPRRDDSVRAARIGNDEVGELTDASNQRFLTNIIGSAKGLGQLIDELLEFSRMGRSELRHMEVDTQELVAGVRHALHPESQGRRIEWRIGELPRIQADSAMLRQVWSNLLGNAVKYTRGRDPATVEVFHRSDEVDGHVFGVRDNGAGFDTRYADKLFGVFQRLHSRRSKRR